MIFIKSVIFLWSVNNVVSSQNIFNTSGDVEIALLMNDCEYKSGNLSLTHKTLVNSAIWTINRIRFLEILSPFTLGLSVYQVCTEKEFLGKVFDISQVENRNVIGIITTTELSPKAKEFSSILDISTDVTKRNYHFLAQAAVGFLYKMGWRENITVISSNLFIMELVYEYSKATQICITHFYILDNGGSIALNATGENPLLFFGSSAEINQFILTCTDLEDKYADDDIPIIFVSLDGEDIEGAPGDSFIILPPVTPFVQLETKTNILPTPLLFDIADPLLRLVSAAKNYIARHCNDTTNKTSCLKNRKVKIITRSSPLVISSPYQTMRTLHIDPLEQHFVYDIYKVESHKSNDTVLLTSNIFLKPFRKLCAYNIFFQNVTCSHETFDKLNESEVSPSGYICPPIFFTKNDINSFLTRSVVSLRSESWIYAFMSLSILGVLVCLSILIFLITCIFQQSILEGNPILSLILLVSVASIFSSVLPFSIATNNIIEERLCLIKSLSVTLSYAALFSLLLSRSILLSTATKEVGFMSHISGTVQSFLCLFIFSVQVSLSLQFFGGCRDLLYSPKFMFFMSYNIILLLLLLCLTPLIYNSQRNYREGKYFTIAIVLISIIWCVWIPSFIMLCREWREFMICFGLVSSGGVCLGAIFIPRTYLMTISAERDKITSALPSLATDHSAMDLYRAHRQPIYDCVNVAAINAATVARAGATPSAPATTMQQPDLYSCPTLPEDINFDMRCDSPTSTDKVTRF